MEKSSSFARASQALLLVILGCIAGCASAPADSSQPQPSVSEAELEHMAANYLFETSLIPTQQTSLQRDIKGLSPEDSVRFARMLRALQGVSSTEDMMESSSDSMTLEADDYVSRLALDRGENRYLIPRDVLADALRKKFGIELEGRHANDQHREPKESIGLSQQALCVFPYSSCTAASFDDTGLKYNACQSGCTVGSTYDRVSNETCELGGCDYRVFYATGSVRANRVDGLTSAANCVVNSWPSILNSFGGGYTRVLYGYNTTTIICGIFSGTYLQQNTRAWKL